MAIRASKECVMIFFLGGGGQKWKGDKESDVSIL